jgi:hypothetical protein
MRAATAWLPALAAALMTPALAQDPFEIHVYEYETPKLGAYTLEAHLNEVGIGGKTADGLLAPTNHQFHMTGELTAGLADFAALGFMLLGAARPGGGGPDYAGWRVLPHFYAPRSWNLPVDLGLVVEFSFERPTYEENSRRVEIRPILEKKIGRLQLDANPVFERALHGPGVRQGWIFEPAARVGFSAGEHFTPSLEYYSSAGPLPGLLPLGRQVHQFFPGADIQIGERVVWSVGVGVGATSTGDRLIYKSRIEISFGAKTN